jgi:hypothetical protein
MRRRDPLPEALEAWEALQQAKAAQAEAERRYLVAVEQAQRVRAERERNHFADLFAAVLRGPR